MSARSRILLADDHALIRAAFASLLQPQYDVVGTVSDGRALLEAAQRLRPDVVVADISMPLLNGIDACQQLRPLLPATRWIFVTVNEDADLAVEAFRLGASGYLLKHSAVEELFMALATVLRGGRHLTPLISKEQSVAAFLATTRPAHADELTPRQREVLQLLAEGRPMKDAARILGVTERTIAFHKYEVMRRLNVKSTAALVQHAIRLGLIRP